MIHKTIRAIVGTFDPIEINRGGCADIADIVWRMTKHVADVEITSDEDEDGGEYTHTFLKYDGRFFDAECPDGVDDWRDLPIYARQRAEGLDRFNVG
jgi:hypothetical protein